MAGPLGATWCGQPTPPMVAQPGPTSTTSLIHSPIEETHFQAISSIDPESVASNGSHGLSQGLKGPP